MDISAWLIIGTVLIIIIVWVASVEAKKEKAKAAYQESLRQITYDPANPDYRRRALTLGRIYANLSRDEKGVTVFDEVALMNDISAACGGATTVVNTPPTPSVKVASLVLPLEDRLARLIKLKEQGLIDNEEYQAKRQKLLDEV